MSVIGLAANRYVISQSPLPRLLPPAPRNRHSPAAKPLNAARLTLPVRAKSVALYAGVTTWPAPGLCTSRY